MSVRHEGAPEPYGVRICFLDRLPFRRELGSSARSASHGRGWRHRSSTCRRWNRCRRNSVNVGAVAVRSLQRQRPSSQWVSATATDGESVRCARCGSGIACDFGSLCNVADSRAVQAIEAMQGRATCPSPLPSGSPRTALWFGLQVASARACGRHRSSADAPARAAPRAR